MLRTNHILGMPSTQVHAAIENVGLKEVWLKIAGGEKARKDWVTAYISASCASVGLYLMNLV